MKKFIAIFSALLFSVILMAQPPKGFKYQAVVRDAAGEIVANQSVDFRLSIRQGSVSGTIVYRETQPITTNAFGLANLNVGDGTATIGSFPDIDWRNGQKFLQIETNLTGSYVTMGTAELMSVPFALYSGSDWLKNGSDIYYNDGKIGIGTSTPESLLHVPKSTTESEGVFGLDISAYNISADVSIGDDIETPVLYVGQSSDYKGFLFWQTNSDPSQAFFNLGTYNGTNHLILQGVGGNVGVGQWPSYKLDVLGDINFTGNLFRNGSQFTGGGWWSEGPYGIYYEGGQVGVGTPNTVAEFHVERNNEATNSQLWIDQEGAGDATMGFWVNSGMTWAIGIDNNDNDKFKISRTADVGVNTAITIDNSGNVGIGTSSLFERLHIEGDQTIHDYYPFITLDNTSTTGNAGLSFETNGAYKGWLYFDDNNDNLVLNAEAGTGWRNDMVIHSNGWVGIKTDSPSSLLDVHYDENTYSYLGYGAGVGSYFYHNEDPADGDGQSAIYSYRTRLGANDGYGYNFGGNNSAMMGYNYWGDIYSFGAAGFNYNDFNRCGGILGTQSGGSYWGSLGYKNSGGTGYGGYFTSYVSGTGKNTEVNIGIGMGAWGDLFGADIHGKVYGTFTEGENYALYANGKMFKNDLDVHLQKTGNENVILYTNVSTNATIQTSGYATMVNGESTITFDEAFANAVSKTEPIVVTVTPTGNSNGVYLEQVNSDGFTVVENNGGKSNVTISYIAIGIRAGYENPVLPREVIDLEYTSNLARGLHNDNDTNTNGEGLYYENGELVVGKHSSVLPDQNKPQEDPYAVKPVIQAKTTTENDMAANGNSLKASPLADKTLEKFDDPSFKNGIDLEHSIEKIDLDDIKTEGPAVLDQKIKELKEMKDSPARSPDK